MKARRPDSFFQTLAGRPFFLPSLVGLFLLGAILLLAFFPKTRSLPLFRHLIGNTPEQVAEAYLDRMKDGNIRNPRP